MSIATIMHKFSGIKHWTFIFAATSTDWLGFFCSGLGWFRLIWEGLTNVCVVSSSVGGGRGRGWLLCSTEPLIPPAGQPWLFLLTEAGVWERVDPTEHHHFPLILLAEASHKASPESWSEETDSTSWWESHIPKSWVGEGWGIGASFAISLQHWSAFLLWRKTIQAVGHRHPPLSWCQFTEKTNKWVMDVIQTIEESSPWQVVGRTQDCQWLNVVGTALDVELRWSANTDLFLSLQVLKFPSK